MCGGRSSGRVLLAVALAVSALGCELQEVTVVEVEDTVIAEVFALASANPIPNSNDPRLWGFLHRTANGSGGDQTVVGATVEVTTGSGVALRLIETTSDRCARGDDGPIPQAGSGTCYEVPQAQVRSSLQAGDLLRLVIQLPDGGTLEGAARVPGVFDLDRIGVGCVLAPDTSMEVRWTPSEGAWAYVNETRIDGLEAALRPEGIEAPSELYLLGLSITAADTTIVFPLEFGVFDRFDLDQALALRLQRGLPDDTRALVAITATDRNYVNWVRGGNFNPSGLVRVPSLTGQGSGVFGALITRGFEVVVTDSPAGLPTPVPACPLR